MRMTWPAWWAPSALWSRHARAHARWAHRQARADEADRRGALFEYEHALVGPFLYHPSHYLSRRIFLHDDFELREVEFAMTCARDGGVILDVGANIGFYTVACARAAGARGHVIAVEPGPQTFAKLTATCAYLGLSNVTLLNVAASSRAGTGQLLNEPHGRDVHQHLADSRLHEGAHCVTVETRPLDDICGDPGAVTLVKIDVEGHEVEVLSGAARILANGRARLIVEVFAAALAAAGASTDALWARLAATHECVAVLAQDGSVRPARRDSLDADGPDAVFNTLWSPRGAC